MNVLGVVVIAAWVIIGFTLLMVAIACAQIRMLCSRNEAAPRHVTAARAAKTNCNADWIAIEACFLRAPAKGVAAADAFMARAVAVSHTNDVAALDVAALEDYHVARAIALHANRDNVPAEELRHAMRLYRSVLARISERSLDLGRLR